MPYFLTILVGQYICKQLLGITCNMKIKCIIYFCMANLIKTMDLQTRQCLKATNVILNKFSINNYKNEYESNCVRK